MKWISVYFLASVFLFVPIFTEEYHCVWYGVCNGKVPCPVTHPAKRLEGSEKAISILKRRCPHFFENGDGK